MLTILYTTPKKFPAGPARKMLSQHVAPYVWTCGEDDDGSDQCAVDYGFRPILLTGRGADDAIFVEVREGQGADGSLPPHVMRIEVRRPATDRDDLAERILAILASTMAFIDKEGVKVRFDGVDRWLGLEDCVRLGEKVIGGERLAEVLAAPSGHDAAPAPAPAPAASGAPLIASRLANLPFPDRLPRARSAVLGFDTLVMATTEQAMAQALGRRGMDGLVDFGALPDFFDEKVCADRLPTLAVLFDRYAPTDPGKLQEILNVFDEEGGWTVTAEAGEIVASGRGGRIRLTSHDEPLPNWMVELALDRSLGATPGEPLARLRGHRRYVAIRPELDCTSASWLDVRQTAKAMVCALAVAARPQHDLSAYSVGLFNAATASCFTGNMLDDLVGALAQDEVSIKTFVWHALPDTTAGTISLSSSGLLPFIGREVEVLDAPGTLDHVGEQLNAIERYLLINGPVLGDGDTIAANPGEPLARAFHALSDAHGRPEPIPVLRFEIRGPDGRWRPRHDPPRDDRPLGGGGVTPPAAPDPAPVAAFVPAGFGRRVGGFGRKGL